MLGLYTFALAACAFRAADEVDGVEVGHYSDFNGLRDYVGRELERGRRGARFPTLMLHLDCDGEWSTADAEKLVLVRPPGR